MLRMMMMEMLALPMRCLLNTLTLCHPWQKGGVVLDMRVVILRRRVRIWHFFKGSADIFEGCSENYLYRFIFSILDTFILVHGSCDHFWHTLYLSSLYVDLCFYHLPLTCVVSFLSFCTCFLLCVCNLLFLFHTKMPWWVLFKVFKMFHKLSSCKVFQEFVLG